MTVNDLITYTKKNEKKIKEQYEVLRDFQTSHPWFVENVRSQLTTNSNKPLPSFEEIISFKEDLLINDLSKIYTQITKNNPDLIDKEPSTLFYYSVNKDFYKKQLRNGFKVGEYDNEGYLVTGSNLIIETVTIDLKEFLGLYYSICN